jgi:hypothetical protein
MICKSFDKGEVPCASEATWTVFWPGRETVSCDRHHEAQQKIAGAMGFALSSRPLATEVVQHSMSCNCGDVTHCEVCGRRAQGLR